LASGAKKGVISIKDGGTISNYLIKRRRFLIWMAFLEKAIICPAQNVHLVGFDDFAKGYFCRSEE